MRRKSLLLALALGLGLLSGCGQVTVGTSALPDSCQAALDEAWDVAEAYRHASNAYVDAVNFASDQGIAAGDPFEHRLAKAKRLMEQAGRSVDAFGRTRDQCVDASGGKASSDCAAALDATSTMVVAHQNTMNAIMESLKYFMDAQLAALRGNPDLARELYDRSDAAGDRYERLLHRLDGVEHKARTAVEECRAD